LNIPSILRMQLLGAMENNELIIAAAGSGKTTHLVKRALENPSKRILITTYTEANEREIRQTIIRLRGYIPANITIQTWFAFLLQHGVRPFQSALDESIHERAIGFYLSSNKSGPKLGADGKPLVWKGKPVFWGEADFRKFYFTNSFRIYSDKISKFVFRCNSVTKGDVINRIARIFDYIFIDEVQDLAGYDLELLKLLFQSESTILLVGDPRQVTYLTHQTGKYKKYANGNLKGFIEEQLGNNTTCAVDETTLTISHRNSEAICDFSNKLYPALKACQPCTCGGCCSKECVHDGIFWVVREEIEEYINLFRPTQLRWNLRTACCAGSPVMNFGESKGLSFDRVVIYPTREMKRWLQDHNHPLKEETRAKLYVAITRARHSVAFVLDAKEVGPQKNLIRYRVADR
jgi:ATP-dependent DNA helicase UvrD/PcrA